MANEYFNQVNSNLPIPSRRQRKSIGRRIITYSIILIIVLSLGSVGVSTYVGWSLTHPDRMVIDDSPSNYGLVYEDVEFKSADGDVKLSGWWIDSRRNGTAQNGKTIIFAHGYKQNRLQDRVPILEMAKLLSDKGYNSLLFDFRNSGVSEGDLTSVGYFEKQDLLGAIQYAKSVYPDSDIVLIGFSMGASVSIITAAESPDVVGVIADSPFDDLDSYLRENLSVWSGLPDFPFTPLILGILPPLTGIKTSEVSPINSVTKLGKRPLLLIHGDADESIPMDNSKRILAAAADNPNAQLWVVQGADHVWARSVATGEYDRNVLAFLESLPKGK